MSATEGRPEDRPVATARTTLGQLRAKRRADQPAFNSAAARPPDLTLPLPRRVPERLRALEALSWAIHVDVVRTLDEMVLNGWSRADALETVRSGYRDWFVENVLDAVEFGCSLWETTA